MKTTTRERGDLVGFRLKDTMVEAWANALEATGSNNSELARACVEEGFQAAVSKMLKAREKARKAIDLKGLKGPFELHLTQSGCAGILRVTG